MKATVWSVSALLALAFLATGVSKLLMPSAELASGAQGIPVILLRLAGVAELLGAFGLILPALTRIRPILTPLAATGLVVTMIGATIANLIIGEYGGAVETLVLGLVAGFLAWARFGPAAIEPRHPRQLAGA